MSHSHDEYSDLYTTLITDAQARYPHFKVIDKSQSWLHITIDRILKALTFGRQSTYLTSYVTTLGQRVYIPKDWLKLPAATRYCTMRHELVHVAQFERFGWIVMTLSYLFFPLPLGFAWGRTALEWQGYRETIAANYQLYGKEYVSSNAFIDSIVVRFTGPDYLWMWLRGSDIKKKILSEIERLSCS